MQAYDEIVADSEGEDDEMLIPTHKAEPLAQSKTTSISANVSAISEFSSKAIIAHDSISNFSSIAPNPNAKSRPKPRPLPKPKSKPASPPRNLHADNFDMTLSIADRAKMRKRDSKSSSSAVLQNDDIIELSDEDEDELALRSPKKPKKSTTTTKPKPPPSIESEPHSSLPVATSPVVIRNVYLPPSDPPQSTPIEFDIPPIAVLPDPSASPASVQAQTFNGDMDMDIDMDTPPLFFAPDTSQSNHPGALRLDSVLIPPRVAPAAAEPNPAKKPRPKMKKASGDGEVPFEGDTAGIEKKPKKAKGKGKDAEMKKNSTTAKAKTKGKGKETEETVFKSSEFIDDNDDDDDRNIDAMPNSVLTITIPPQNVHVSRIRSPVNSTAPENAVATDAHQRSPGSKRARSTADELYGETGDGKRKKPKNASEDGTAPAVTNDRGVNVDIDWAATVEKPVSTSSASPSVKLKPKGRKRVRVVSDDDDDDGVQAQEGLGNGNALAGAGTDAGVFDAPIPTKRVTTSLSKSPSKSKSKSKTKETKGKAKSKSTAKSKKAVEQEGEINVNVENEQDNGVEDGVDVDVDVSSVKENIPATPAPNARVTSITQVVPGTPASEKSLKYPSLVSRYTLAPKSALKSTPMSELIRRANSTPNSYSSPISARKGKANAGAGVSSEDTNGITASPSRPTAYSPYLKSSRSLLSRIAPLHPNRRPPPLSLPPPPPRKKTRKELEWEKKTLEEKEELEEKWEQELVEWVGGRAEWESLGSEQKRIMLRSKKDRELGLGGWEE